MGRHCKGGCLTATAKVQLPLWFPTLMHPQMIKTTFVPASFHFLSWVCRGWESAGWLHTCSLCWGDTRFSFTLPAGGVGLAAPFSAGLVSCRLLPSTVPFLCPLPVRGEGSTVGEGWVRRQWLPSCSWVNVKAPTNPLPWFSA